MLIYYWDSYICNNLSTAALTANDTRWSQVQYGHAFPRTVANQGWTSFVQRGFILELKRVFAWPHTMSNVQIDVQNVTKPLSCKQSLGSWTEINLYTKALWTLRTKMGERVLFSYWEHWRDGHVLIEFIHKTRVLFAYASCRQRNWSIQLGELTNKYFVGFCNVFVRKSAYKTR